MTSLLILIIYILMGIHVGQRQFEYFQRTSPSNTKNEFAAVVCGIFCPIILIAYIFHTVFFKKWNWGDND